MFNRRNKIKNDLELISLHIPKTAGTSFFLLIREVYGNEHVARLDYIPHLKKLYLDNKAFDEFAFPDSLKVVHGHFNLNILKDYIKLHKRTKVITWLRDPVQRVISDYYYLVQIVNLNYNTNETDPNVLNRLSRSLIEYARMEIEQNRMANYLRGTKLKDLFFVGITESMETDLKCLAQLLNWGAYAIKTVNKTRNKANDISQDVIEEIKSLNKLDVELYEEALEINATMKKKYK